RKANEAFVVKMRHKKPNSDVSTLREYPVAESVVPFAKASEDFRFAAAVSSFAMILRQSAHQGVTNLGTVQEWAMTAMSHDPGGYRAEFLDLVKKARSLSQPR
ncbi:MAG: YfbK domain-containing protein, partial [Gemmataceae bacterium]